MRRMLAAGAVIVMCLSAVSHGVTAQSPTPGRLPLITSGTGTCTVVERGTRGTSDALVQGASGARGQTLDCVLAMDDPRVSGPAALTFNDDCFGTTGGRWGCVFWGTASITGPEGGWDCSYTGSSDPTGHNDGVVLHVCAGVDGYSGLTFMAQQAVSFSGPADFGDGTSIRGIVYEGPLPPWGPLPTAAP